MSNLTDHTSLSRRAVFVLLLGAASISLAPIFVRLSEIGPSATAFYRLFFALPVLWVWMRQDARHDTVHRQPSSINDYWRLSLAGFFFAGDLALWHWSITLTSVANSTLLANFAPVFVTLGGYFLFGERFSRTFLFGMFCAIGGVVILLGGSFAVSTRHLLGDALGVGTAVFYAAYIMAVGRLRAEFSTATVMTWSGVVTCVALVPITVISGESFIAGTAFGWLVLAGLALISHAGGQSMIAYALAHLPAAFGSVGLLLQPALAALIAWYLFGESLDLSQLAGGVIILAGIYFARRGS